MPNKKNIFVAGHNGMVGSAIIKRLKEDKDNNIIIAPREEYDLSQQNQVEDFFQNNSIDQVYLAAAKVGGIQANNNYPADFIYKNIMIQANTIHASFKHGIEKLLFLGSSCIYPKYAKQPMAEKSLLTGILEPTNEPYAVAKIAGIKMCESYNRQHNLDYRSIMPTNLYGPGDNFDSDNSHVIPALIRRFHQAKKNKHKQVVVWGTGAPKREFLHVSEMADASIYIMNIDANVLNSQTEQMLSHINIGSGKDCSISYLAKTIADIVGYEGKITWDESKPDGAPQKLLNVDLLKSLGWHSKLSLEDGLADTYEWYKESIRS